MACSKVLVFGPTGNVARVAATTASKHGVKVFLVMRDPQKSIPGLSSEDEKNGDYERVQADLTQPNTVKEAASKTGAKRAFIYLAHGSQDHMRATLEALKAGGVEFVVFLSSYTVKEPLEKIPPQDIIPYMHARTEMQLLEVFGEKNFVALRPGGFATNILTWNEDGIKAGHVKLWSPKASFDMITPDDMGEVAGLVLAKELKDQHIIYLFGPKMISQEDQIHVVEKALGKEIKIEDIDEQAAVQQYQQKGIPEVFAKYLAARMGEIYGKGFSGEEEENFHQGVKNVEKFTGHKATGFEEWVKANLDRFR
ncbi:Putative NAD(P)-binding domain, NAD(P)-binding domain superfamily [Septoria linicola]|uniref:NAD(P)-binding domain, NAD(P)-binding domain superfamily n=1 Tax=Septoria linicola TaxID=215465 RepID=A0A9Q9ANT2_9PEZI|nr:Putative NAD(P)-binding domain, NAD(P)-binding domain superfamily [Septoria linicola]